ncbi:MAG TPA: hypothetical protein VEB19_11570 [Gemmatimonadaceae bacterium]|nr:hypothetical protein [Gemmatimonadaceae bacterium]
MNQELMALLVGALLAVAALAYVLFPLFEPTQAEPVERSEVQEAGDAIEARVRAVRQQHPRCDACGVRPEADAIFCSNCGRAVRVG